MKPNQKCKRLKVKSEFLQPKVIYGIIVQQDENFLTFKTGKGREYTFSIMEIISIEDTDRVFEEVKE